MTIKGGNVDIEDLRDWAKLDSRWYEDPRIELAADECEAAFSLWPVLIGMAKAASSAKRNPDGVVRITPRKLAFAARCDLAVIGPALQALEHQELISCTGEGNQCLSISLVGFARWQKPRGSEADRKARYRERKKMLASRDNAKMSHDCPTDVPSMSHECPTPVPNVSHRQDKTRQDKTPQEKTRQIESVTNQHAGGVLQDAAADSSLLLPDAVAEACEIAAVTGIRSEWWQSSVQKLRRRHASLPDEAFIKALDWIVAELDGQLLAPQRAWAMLNGSVKAQARSHREATQQGAASSQSVGVDAAVLYWVEKQIGRELSSDEDHALQAGTMSVEAFLAKHAPGVTS